MRLSNKVIIVTASTRGIGYAIVEACAKQGATVYMAARNERLANEKIQGLNELSQNIHFVYNDALKKETYSSMIEEVIKKEGKIDVLVNNFGTSDPEKDLDIEKTEYEDFLNILDNNLASVFLSSQAVIPYMKIQGYGSIINISSIGGIIPDIARIGYTVSKDAIIYLSKTMALQLGNHSIRVNVVCPGQTETDAVKDNLTAEFQDVFLKHTPIKRMAKPKEIANAVLYFASDESLYTTGQVISVSGGFGLGTPLYADFRDIDTSSKH